MRSSMSRAVTALAAPYLLFVCIGTPPAHAAPANDVAAQLSKFRVVKMPFSSAALSPRERLLVEKLAAATRLADEVYWQQGDPAGLALYRSLAGSAKPQDQALRRFLRINGGRYDLINENAPFAGAGPKPAGGTLYPSDLTRAEFEGYVATHPQQKAALYDPLTVVRRKGSNLVAVPYHVVYRRWLVPMAAALKEAAALSDDAAFAKFLTLRAKALLDDDYYASDLAWLDLANPKFDLIFAPYETYLDGFLGVKGSFGAAVLVRNETESEKLQVFQKFVPDIQDALPLAAEDRPSKHGHASPMEVMDAPLRGGDLRHGYQAVADNLPNDPRVHEQKGTKKIFFKNFMDARVDYVILPIAQRLMKEDQAAMASAEGYLTDTLMHEISHGLGPVFSRTPNGRVDIRAAIGARFSALEEAKADIVGLFALKWLADRGDYPEAKLKACYASDVAGIFRTVRFSIAEAHGQAEIMEFNFFREKGVITLDRGSGRYAIDFAAFPKAVASLAQELLEMEASGDSRRVDAWFAKYGQMTAELKTSLRRVSDVPVDVDPVFDFHES